MTREQIEKAANIEMLSHYADEEYPCSIKDIQSDFKEAFKIGAEYALSHQLISVEEALPEANEHVLALIGGVPVVAKGYHVRARLRDITNWMPIPRFETKEKKWKR